MEYVSAIVGKDCTPEHATKGKDHSCELKMQHSDDQGQDCSMQHAKMWL